MVLGDILERNVRLYPDSPAVVADDRRLTFAAFGERVFRLANALAGRGLGRGDRVAVLAYNGTEYLEAYGAGEVAGTVTTTLNYRLALPELHHLISDSAPKALVFDPSFAGTVDKLRPSFPPDAALLCIGESYEAALAAASPARPKGRPEPDDTAYILYTSGTTGRPKGAMLGHRGQLFGALSSALESLVDPTDRMLVTNPLYHAGGKWMQMAFHARGCPVYLHKHFDPAQVLQTIARERITATILPATMLQALLNLPDFGRHDLSCLRKIYYSAGPMPVPLLRKALDIFGPILIQFYGCTEAGGVGTCLHQHQHVLDGPEKMQRRLASAGQPKLMCDLRVVGEDGRDCPVGEPGEILLKSEAVMQGYWNNPAGTAEALQDGWLRTGDVGALDEDCFLYVVDRKKDMIVSGGVNIYSREVEDALYHHAGVLEAAVIGVPHQTWGETVHAVIVRRPGSTVSESEIIEHCRTLIASFKKPTSVSFLNALPKLPNGKVDKVALREPFWAGYARRVN